MEEMRINVKWYEGATAIGEVMEYCAGRMLAEGRTHPPELQLYEWDEVLTKIRDAGELLATRDDWQDEKFTDHKYAAINEGMALLAIYIHDMWD